MLDIKKTLCSSIALLGLFFLGLLPAYGFNANGLSWAAGEAPYFTTPISITGSDGLTRTQITTAFETALDSWSDNTNFNFIKDRSSVSGLDVCSTGVSLNPENNNNVYTFSPNICDEGFGNSTLAVEISFFDPTTNGALVQSNIIFNSNIDWNIYTGPQLPILGIDFTRVAVHELGHALGLAHSDTDLAIMWPFIGDINTPQEDDINGANFIYEAFQRVLITPILLLLLE